MEGSPFVEDPGPGFDEEAAQEQAQGVHDEEAAQERAEGIDAYGIPEVPEEKVRHSLFVAGDGLHAAVGVGEYDWKATEADLDRIAPPLARIINRYELTKAIAGYSDELSLAVGVGLWGWRSVLERAAVIRAAERAGESTPPPQDIRTAPRRPGPGPAPPPPPPGPGPPPPPPEPMPPPATPAAQDAFPGAGPPQEPPPVAEIEVVDGYVTRAERFRQAQERRPDAIPREAPPAS